MSSVLPFSEAATVPTKSGIYMVILRNKAPKPIDLDSRRPNCLRVTRENCKVGKAKDLQARGRCYSKIFGGHGLFVPLAIVEDISRVEKEILKRLHVYRVQHNRRRLEWLQEIAPSEVRQIVLTVLQDLDVDHTVL